MAKPFKTQWEFGELFPADNTGAGRKVLTVAELTFQIRRLLEKEVGQIWVTGEITNLRAQSSGHIYFTLKDAAAQLSCVLFRGEQLTWRLLIGAVIVVVAVATVVRQEPAAAPPPDEGVVCRELEESRVAA